MSFLIFEDMEMQERCRRRKTAGSPPRTKAIMKQVGNSSLGEIIDVRPQIEVLSPAVDFAADSRWRIQG
jgi:hypothetical protein